MDRAGRVAGMLMWLAALWVVGTVIVAIAASRVGASASTTYGDVHEAFENSWGGKLTMQPAAFQLHAGSGDVALLPEAIDLDVDITHRPTQEGLVRFQAFEVASRDTYTVTNTLPYAGTLQVELTEPGGAQVMRDYALEVLETQQRVRPQLGQPVTLEADLAPGETRTIALTWGAKGLDRYRFRLSDLSHVVMPSFTAHVDVDGSNWRVLKKGLPHERKDGSLTVDLADFTSNHDLGVAFRKPKDLGRVATTLVFSPLTLLGLLAGVSVHSQVQRVRFASFHYAVIALVHTLYFVFAAYLVRMLEPGWAWLAAACLAALLGGLYLPQALGRRFTIRIVLPYLLCATLGLTAALSVPALQGLAMLCLTFGLLLTVLLPLADADFDDWPLFAELPQPERPTVRHEPEATEPAPVIA